MHFPSKGFTLRLLELKGIGYCRSESVLRVVNTSRNSTGAAVSDDDWQDPSTAAEKRLLLAQIICTIRDVLSARRADNRLIREEMLKTAEIPEKHGQIAV